MTKTVISIDVGIKNLALCLFEYTENTFNILEWSVLNLGEDSSDTTAKTKPKCLQCARNATYVFDENQYCITHIKNITGILFANSPYFYKTAASLKKKTTAELKDIRKHQIESVNTNNIDTFFSKPPEIYLSNNRQTLITDIRAHCDKYQAHKLADIAKKNKTRATPSGNGGAESLIRIAHNLRDKLDDIVRSKHIDTVLIENQIGPLAVRMKSIQGMLVQYFCIRQPSLTDVRFVSAAVKLTPFQTTADLSDYSVRKRTGIIACRFILKTFVIDTNWQSVFEKHSKKDDLSDALLQGWAKCFWDNATLYNIS